MNTPTGRLRILGLDPGLRSTGYGVIDRAGPRLTFVACGCVRTDDRLSLPGRLGQIFAGVGELIRLHRPDCVAIEQVFVNINPQSTLLLGQARGGAICAAVAEGMPVAEYTALQIKQAVVGAGHAAKTQVQHMVVRLLTLAATPSADAADALACAICHAHADQGAAAMALDGLRQRAGRLLPVRTARRGRKSV